MIRHSQSLINSFRELSIAAILGAFLVLSANAQGIYGALAAPSTNGGHLAIGSGDVLDVRVFDTPELSGQMRVAENGTIALPAGGVVRIIGLTPEQAAMAVESDLKTQGIMLDPHVTITITEFATEGITVAGEVKSPGIYTLLGDHSLYDLLSAAGGPTPYEGPTITITHKGDPAHPIIQQVHSAAYSEALNRTRVFPGDTVFVSRAGVVYVIGAVGRSGAFVMQDDEKMTVLTSLALAQGPSPTAALKKAEIVRQTSQGLVVIQLNLKAVFKHKLRDVALNSGDIVVVPSSGVKDFTMRTLPGLATGAATTALAYSLLYQ